jgi:hypothetical protein
MNRPLAAAALVFTALTFAACGGGSSGSGGGSPVLPTSAPTNGATSSPAPSPTATATTSTLAVTGSLTEFTSSMPLSGFTVTVGAVPAFTSCLASQTATSQPCGVAAAPTVTTTTSASGTFSIAVPATGTYFLTIGLNSTYATLHKEITVATGGLALGTVHVAALTSDEQNWVVDVNNQRATVSFPTSFPNLVVDEYAEENARALSVAIGNGTIPQTDAAAAAYLVDYANESGGIWAGPGFVDTMIGLKARSGRMVIHGRAKTEVSA